MKNNKYAPYILAPVVLVIWGTIFYKVYQAVMGEELEVPAVPTGLFSETAEDTNDEPFTLLLDYKDPFLGKKLKVPESGYKTSSSGGGGGYSYNYGGGNRNAASRSNQRSSTQRLNTPPKNNQQPKNDGATIKSRIPNFPKVIYQGDINKTSAILKVNGRFYPSVGLGETVAGMSLDRIFTDSIHVTYQGTPATILKMK